MPSTAPSGYVEPRDVTIDSRFPNALRWRGSVLRSRRLLVKISIITALALIVCLVNSVAKVRLGIPTNVIVTLGTTVSLLLVFRTNTAYDRFWEGRRVWSQVTSSLRSMMRMIWVGVQDAPNSRVDAEKRAASDLLIAFAVSTKHYLREEYGHDFPDLFDHLDHIPTYNTPAATIPIEEAKRRMRMDPTVAAASNIPLEITIYLGSFIQHQLDNKRIDVSRYQMMTFNLMSLTDSLTQLERILRSPIPLAYSIHLAQTVWLYLLALPFQLVADLGYWTIPASAIIAAVFFGIESIGGEIENPFGYDANDLPMDRYCSVIRGEIEQILKAGKITHVQDWAMINEADFASRFPDATPLGTPRGETVLSFSMPSTPRPGTPTGKATQ